MTQVQIKSNTNYRTLISLTNGDIQMVITMFEDSIAGFAINISQFIFNTHLEKHRYMISGKEY